MQIKKVKSTKSMMGVRVSKEARQKAKELIKKGYVVSWLFERAVNEAWQEEIGQFLPDEDGISEAELKVLHAMERAEREKTTKLDSSGYGDDDIIYDPDFKREF